MKTRTVDLKELKSGDLLVCDGTFPCLHEAQIVAVEKDAKGQLFVKCEDGKHFLSGQQFSTDPYLIGFRKVDN